MNFSAPTQSEQKLSLGLVTAMLTTVVVLWGINIIMLKYLTNHFPPLALAGIRLSIAASLLLPACFFRYGPTGLPRKAWLPVGGVALFTIFLHQIALSWGVMNTSATHSVLILSLNPLVTTLLASWFVKEPVTWNKGLGVLIGLTGILLIVTQKDSATASTLSGDGAIGIAMLTYVIGSLFVKKSTQIIPALVVTAYSHLFASLGLLALATVASSAWMYETALEPWPLFVLFFSGWISTAVGALWWNTGISYVGASTASLFLNGSPVVGVFASAFFLGEALHWQHYLSLILVLLGVGLGTGLFSRLYRPAPVENN